MEDRKKKAEAEIEQLKIYHRQGVHSAFTGMHYRSLQRKYPAVWDRLAFPDRREDREERPSHDRSQKRKG